MIYDKYEGNTASVHIENVDEKDPYTSIGAKAFLSCKNVYEIKLPATILEIGDWAFAHMKELKRIIVPAEKISIGKAAFLDCDSLEEIVVSPDDSGNQGLPFLLASCITILKASALLDFSLAAKENELWCKKYDESLLEFVKQSDEKDFQPVIVGWFNDEGEEEQLERFIEKVKADKLKLSLLRLKYDYYISDETKTTLLSYLENQIIKIQDYECTSWKILRKVLAEDIQYVKLCVSNDLLSEELILELIKYFNDNNVSAEIVSFLVSSLTGRSKGIEEQFEL